VNTEANPIHEHREIRLGGFGSYALILAVTLAAYWPALRGGLIWDDDAHVTKPGLQSLEGLRRIWFDLGATQQYYPVLHSAFWVEHRLWGDSTLGYHVINVVLHGTAAFLFGLVLRQVARPWPRFRFAAPRPAPAPREGLRSGGGEPLFPWVAALIFALHPVCVESVAWISEQKNTLSTVFYLLAALAYLNFEERRLGSSLSGSQPSGGDGRRAGRFAALGETSWGWYALAFGFFLLALLTKSVTATLPAALLIVFWWQRGRLSWKRDILTLLPWFVAGLAAGLFTAWVERQLIGARGAAFDLGWAQRFLLAGRAVGFYAAKLFWPAHLVFVYPRWRIDAGSPGQYLFLLAAAGVLAVLWAIRHRTRGPFAGALFFVATLFPALGFVNVYPFIFSYVADHFQYLASLGLIALVCGGFEWVGRRMEVGGQGGRPGVRVRSRLPQILATAVICGLGVLTWRQCQSYRDVEMLYRTTLARNPDSWMPHFNLGVIQGRKGLRSDAIAEYRRAIELKPDYPQAHFNLGCELEKIPGRMNDAIAEYREAVRLEPNFGEAQGNLGGALAGIPGRLGEALGHLEAAVRLEPDSAEAHNNLGSALAETPGRQGEAVAQFDQSLRLNPGNAAAENSLGLVYVSLNRFADAASHFRRAVRLSPGDAPFHVNLAGALDAGGDPVAAVGEMRTAVRLRPDFADAHYNLAVLLQRMGNDAEARVEFDQARKLGFSR
jgi:Flp pilus assembly protein TadD